MLQTTFMALLFASALSLNLEKYCEKSDAEFRSCVAKTLLGDIEATRVVSEIYQTTFDHCYRSLAKCDIQIRAVEMSYKLIDAEQEQEKLLADEEWGKCSNKIPSDVRTNCTTKALDKVALALAYVPGANSGHRTEEYRCLADYARNNQLCTSEVADKLERMGSVNVEAVEYDNLLTRFVNHIVKEYELSIKQ